MNEPRNFPLARLLAGAVCTALFLSALALGTLGVFAEAKPTWFLIGFEAVIALAAVFGVLTAAGRFAQGAPVSFACVAGAVVVCTVLGGYSVHWALGGHSLRLLVIGRGAGAALVAAVGAWMVLGRCREKAVPLFMRAAGAGLGFCIVVAGVWALRGHLGAVPAIARFLGGILVFGLAIGLLAAAVDYAMRSFGACDSAAEASAGPASS